MTTRSRIRSLALQAADAAGRGDLRECERLIARAYGLTLVLRPIAESAGSKPNDERREG